MQSGDGPDRLELRALSENWVLWRDTGDWDRLRSTWHDDGRMVTTWCEASADDFVALCRKAWENGSITARHSLGDIAIELTRDRAIMRSRFRIIQRVTADGVLADVTCLGRFYDFAERRGGRWGIVLRQPAYEGDRIDPVDPAATISLDAAILAALPPGYRHLAYVQKAAGLPVNLDLPGSMGVAFERLTLSSRAWLAGAS